MNKFNIDDIKISSKLDKCIINSIKEGYEKSNTKKSRKKKYRNIIVAASIVLVIISGVNSEFVSGAVDKIKNTIGDFSLNNKYSIPNEEKKVIGKTIEDKKIKVTLNECYVDSGKLMFTTNLNSLERHDEAQGIDEVKIYVNGQFLDIYDNDYTYRSIYNDDGTVDLLSSISLENIDTDKELNITIDYNEITVMNIFDKERNIKGDWKYNFTINKSEINQQVITKEINEKVSIEDLEINIKSIKVYPYRIELATNGLVHNGYMNNCVIRDDKGNEYMSENGGGPEENFVSNYYLDTKDIKSITIIPRTDFNNDIPVMNYDKAVTVNIR